MSEEKKNNHNLVDPTDEAVVKPYVDAGWPEVEEGHHAVTELLADKSGPLSPFGDQQFPVPSDELPYVHPRTIVNF